MQPGPSNPQAPRSIVSSGGAASHNTTTHENLSYGATILGRRISLLSPAKAQAKRQGLSLFSIDRVKAQTGQIVKGFFAAHIDEVHGLVVSGCQYPIYEVMDGLSPAPMYVDIDIVPPDAGWENRMPAWQVCLLFAIMIAVYWV